MRNSTLKLNFNVTESTRILEYTIDEGDAHTVISIELPEEIKIEDGVEHDCDDDNGHDCPIIELTETPQQLHDPVYTCKKCGEGPSLLCFHGEPTFLMNHIEQCLGLEPIESQENDVISVRYLRS